MTDKVVLTDVSSGYNLAKINENFEILASAINDNMLGRTSAGEDNQMELDLDMNGKTIYNLPTPSSNTSPVRKIDLLNAALNFDSLTTKNELYLVLKRLAAEAGYNLVSGSFEEGAEITGSSDLVWYQTDGNIYQWSVDEAKSIETGSEPTNIGVDWISKTNITLRDELSDDTGADLVNFNTGLTGAVTRALSSKLTDVISIKDFGGVCDGTTNDASALIAALSGQSSPVLVNRNSYLSFTIEQVPTLIANLNRIYPEELTVFNLPAGEAALTANVDISNPYAVNIDIKAPQPTSQTVTAVTNNSGSAGAYSVTYTVASASGFTVGKYAIISAATGSDKLVRAIEGCFKVTATTSTTVTVLHTLYGTWPTFTLTSATITPINTVLRWADNIVGMRIFGTTLRALRNLVIAGSYTISSNTPADSACDGFQVGAAPNTPVTGLNESEQVNDGAVWCQYVGFVEWRGNGVQVKGGKFYGTSVSACSNGWRGFQAASNGYCSVKYSSACGNGASGYEAEAGGITEAYGASACGNYQQGAYAIGLSQIDFDLGVAVANASHGIDARNGATVQADGAVSRSNLGYGVNNIASKVILGSSAITTNNTTYDIAIDEGGIVDASGASDIGTYTASDDKACLLILISGSKYYPNSKKVLKHGTSSAGYQISVSSIGDVTHSFDTSGSGTYTSRKVSKADGIEYPADDALTDLGRSANRYRYGYFSGGVLTTSDERLKDLSDLTEVLKAIGTELKPLISQYVFKSSKDTDIHIGISAQKVCDVFSSHGLDAVSYGIVDHATWEEELDEEGNVTLAAGDRYSVNYQELVMLIIASL